MSNYSWGQRVYNKARRMKNTIVFYVSTNGLRRYKRIECDYSTLFLHQKLLLYPQGGSYFLGKGIQIGYEIGGRFKRGYCELQARNLSATITIGDYTSINNNFLAISCEKIDIGKHCRIGINCQMIDSDFHSLKPNERSQPGTSKAIEIHNNVWIGNNTVILKGVEIGENSVVGAGSVVTKSIPCNELWAGSPAKFIRKI